MIHKEHFEQYNGKLNSWILEACNVSSLDKLSGEHIPTLEKIFRYQQEQYKMLLAEEWGLDKKWINHVAKFEHDPTNHLHSLINPFGMSQVKYEDSSYIVSPHLHIGEHVVGGDNIVFVLKEISSNFAFDQLNYVVAQCANSFWQKNMEANMTRQNFILSNDGYNMPEDKIILSKKEAAPEYSEDGKKAYDATRLNKYDKAIDTAKVGEVMGAFGEALDEVLNRRDIKPAEKDIKAFLGVGASEMSEGEKSFPGFYIPMAIMALDAMIAKKYRVVSTTNYENWSKTIKPIGFGMYETKLNREDRLMHDCYQFCELKSNPDKKVIIRREVHNTMSGLELTIACTSALEEASLYSDLFDGIKDWIKENNYYKGQKIDATGKFLNVAKYSWDNIILEEDVKDNIFDDVVGFLNYADLYKTNDLPFKRGLILYGKPGCGKTLLGKVIANQVKSSFIWITAAQASSPSFVRSVFGLAREIAPCVLFFEDIDMYTVDRGYGAFNSLVGELLAQMDGMEENNGLIVVATTNRLDVIEKALAERPSRFDRRYSLDFMSLETTEKMVKEKLGNAKLDDISTLEIAKLVFGLNGCFIQEVVVSAKRKAISRGSVGKNGLVILDQDILKESTAEVTTAFKIALDRLQQGELAGFLRTMNNDDAPDSKDMSDNKIDITIKHSVENAEPVMVLKNGLEPITFATAKTPRNVNLTHPEKEEVDIELKDALNAIAKYAEYDDKSEIEDYTSKEKLNDHAIAVAGSTFDEIDWDSLNKTTLRKMFRLMTIRHNVVKTANSGFDPLKDRENLGKMLHAMDMLSDRYYWVYTYYRICSEFGLKINIPFNPYKDQTSKDGALKLYDILTGKVKSAKEKEDAVNKKNNVFVPTQQDYDMPELKHNDPKVANINRPDLME